MTKDNDHVYNAAGFQNDAGDIVLADNIEDSEKLRRALINALYWVERGPEDSPIFYAERIRTTIYEVGKRIVLQTMKNGYSIKNLGITDE